MKKITKLFLAIMMLFTFSMANAQLTADGTLDGAPNNTMVIFNYEIDSILYVDTLFTDASGFFTAGPYALGGTTQGAVNIAYTDCNGNDTMVFTAYSPISTYVDFGVIDWCPVATPSYNMTTNVNFTNNSGIAVDFELSWDGGSSFVSYTTDAAGNFILVQTASYSGDVILSYTDCNGNTWTETLSYSSASPTITYDNDFCPVACGAGFGFYQNFNQDSLTGVITYYGPIMIANSSFGANPAAVLTYTWNFGDGSPAYTGTSFTHVYSASGAYNVCLTIDDGLGCTDTYCDSLIVDAGGELAGKANGGFTLQMGAGDEETEGPNAINDLQKDVTINIYPNPATNNINISLNSEINENVSLEIYDLTGKLVQTNNFDISTGNQIVNVELNNLNKGMYIAQLVSKNGTLSTKLTIK